MIREWLASTRLPVAPALSFLLAAAPVWPVEPGVDIASPRVAISTVGNTLAFSPANLVVEQGDYVRWIHTGTSVTHTTTSGVACTGNGIWNGGLGPGAQFTRRFADSPGDYPYFCIPHCGLGMIGSVWVTTLISLKAEEIAGLFTLSWTGGGGSYRVFRSADPRFPAASTQVNPPQGGDVGTSFVDPEQPALDRSFFYLVMNRF